MFSVVPVSGLILASRSPRRREILTRLGLSHTAIEPAVDEASILSDIYQSKSPGADIGELVTSSLALLKAQWVHRRFEPSGKTRNFWIIGADTIIEIENELFGKPDCREHAEKMLSRLAGAIHKVVTAVAIIRISDGASLVEHECSSVQFAALTRGEIDRYIHSGEWRGAAGGYRIQETGEMLIESITGSYSNIMGLPIRRFCGMLARLGFSI